MKALRLGVLVACSALASAAPASAETLREAMATAYQNNPVLEAQRAALRATDENVAQAVSGWRPTIQAQGSVARDESENFFAGGMNEVLKPKQGSVSLTQPIFRSFRTITATREAKSQVKAGRAVLADTEQTVLLDTVRAYMDVLRDQAVLELRRNNVQVLTRQLEASEDRFEVGEITRTDVAQSEARLAQAVSGRISAEAQLARSRAAYQRIVGNMPGTLEEPPSLPDMPQTEGRAYEVALNENPDLLSARFTEEAARHAVGKAKSELGPEFTFVAEYSKVADTFIDGFESESKTLTARATVPLYQSGAVSSRIRQAKAVASQRRIEVRQAERIVQEGVRNAWEALRASRSTIQSSEAQVRANEIALEGVRQEAEVGSRTTLDVLDAEQELLDSRVTLVESQRDEYVAAYELLAALGRVNAAYLALPVEMYDPEINYDRARNSWYGWWD